MNRLLLSAGEPSGDAYGGALLAELRTHAPDLHVQALGGPKIRATKAQMLGDSSTWGAISITQALRLYPRVARSYYRVKRELSRGEPGLFLPIDFGYANLRLARHAKSRGWKVLYSVPPSSWRRDRQGRDVPAVSDVVITPFPWSADLLRAMGADARFYGHPIKSLAPPPFHGERRGVALLPGSRASEIETLLPVYAEAVRGLDEPILIPVPASRVDLVRRLWAKHGGPPAEIAAEGAWPALQRVRAAVVCSGTATLEAALARTPFVLAYRLSKATLLEARLIRYKPPRFVGLPNILLDRPVVPELLQDDAQPERVRAELARLLTEGDPAQMAAFEELDALLGPPDAIPRTAQTALAILRPKPQP